MHIKKWYTWHGFETDDNYKQALTNASLDIRNLVPQYQKWARSMVTMLRTNVNVWISFGAFYILN